VIVRRCWGATSKCEKGPALLVYLDGDRFRTPHHICQVCIDTMAALAVVFVVPATERAA
jgi:(2Fe-2S) ferredoxin